MKAPVTRLDYCQYLLVSQLTYTLTNVADHGEQFSHDAVNRSLRQERITPRLIWDHVRSLVVPTVQGSVGLEDTVLDKNASHALELVRRQYSGNAKAVLKGIGGVTCVYLNPRLDQFWLIDYRLYEPAGDGQTKLDHVRARLVNVVYQKQLPLAAVLMDSWYATQALLRFIEGLQQRYDCPLKANRQGDASSGAQPYRRVDPLTWSAAERLQGKVIQSKGCPKDPRVRLFRVEGSTHRTAWVVTHEPTQKTTAATQAVCGCRWKSEPWPREGKPVTGLERCQGRKARIQRHQMGCAFLVWVRRKALAVQTGRTIYQ